MVRLSLGKLRKGHDNATESCFKSFRRIRCGSFGNVVRSHVGSDGESARRSWGAAERRALALPCKALLRTKTRSLEMGSSGSLMSRS